MQFRFDPSQDFQLEAIAAVVDLFAGQRRAQPELVFGGDGGAAVAVANRLDLNGDQLLRNLQLVQQRNLHQISTEGAPIRVDEALAYLSTAARGSEQAAYPNFTVEMETGTGKTYVYLRTALALHHRYGMRKFIVVVPSLAIREGVLKTLQMTHSHFADLYDRPPLRYYAYASENLSQVRQFALSDGIELMVMTLASFNKAANVIHQPTDRLLGEIPVHLIQSTRPILILDEPQNMESERSIAALAALHPLFALRYSATHRNPYNLVYRLTPFEAYRRQLVKRIEVASVIQEQTATAPFIRLLSIEARRQKISAQVMVHCREAHGSIRAQTITVLPGEALTKRCNTDVYRGFEIEEINAAQGFVRFANGESLGVGEATGTDSEAVFAAQIRATVVEHLEKQREVRPLGVKVLSLFFIDKVANYAGQDAVIRRLFDRIFDEEKRRFPEWADKQAGDVQAAYFAQRRARDGQIVFEDSKSGEAQRDQEAFDLIMKDKERLLSFDEPVAFIFSHSALREGWDNPNVFQICTLNRSLSDTKKRQEIGRGVRLAVNQQGERVHDADANVLTVVANESYQSYVAQLQSEVVEEFQADYDLGAATRRSVVERHGVGILPPMPANRSQRVQIRLRQAVVGGEETEFAALWSRLSLRTRYRIPQITERLIAAVVASLSSVQIAPPQITLSRARLDLSGAPAIHAFPVGATRVVQQLFEHGPLPNLADVILELLLHANPPLRVTKRTILHILRRLPSSLHKALIENPNELARAVATEIQHHYTKLAWADITYEQSGERYDQNRFPESEIGWQDRAVPAAKSIYSYIICHSLQEQAFVSTLEARADVLFYLRLPSWYSVPTPFGAYTPGWALVIKDDPQPGDIAENRRYLACDLSSHLKTIHAQKEERHLHSTWLARHFDVVGMGYQVQ